jgi:hypothetical protein
VARTPEQVAADDALTAAVEAVQFAYLKDGEDVGGVLTEYLVIATRRNWDEDGNGWTTTSSRVRDGEMPLDRQLGLVEYAAVRIRKRIAED